MRKFGISPVRGVRPRLANIRHEFGNDGNIDAESKKGKDRLKTGSLRKLGQLV